MPEIADPLSDRTAVIEFLAQLGAAMLAAAYPIQDVRHTLTRTADQYQVTCPLLVLPNFVQVGDADQTRAIRADKAIRYDQTFPLGDLVHDAEHGAVTAADGLAELNRIHSLPRRFPAWVEVIGYAVQSGAFALMLEPTLAGLTLATAFGLGIGGLELLTRRNAGIRLLLPAVTAGVVTFTAFSLGRLLQFEQYSLHILIPPLALFLPGVAITLAVLESTAGEVVSAAGRLTAGLLQLMQLALGIVIAIQLVGVPTAQLTDAEFNRIGPWAPWLGVAVYAVGVLLRVGPRFGSLPWLLLVLYITYGSQVATAAVSNGYVSGFGGGLALMLCALALSRHRSLPSAQVLLTPGFWLLVPSSAGLIGIAELAEGRSSGLVIAMLASMMAIALGFQTGLSIWRTFVRAES